MIETSPGDPFDALLIGASSGLAGTVGVRIIDTPTGSTVLARTTAGITEQVTGSGVYAVTLTAPGSVGRYAALWDTGGTLTPANTTAEELLVALPITAGQVLLVNPVAQSGDVTLIRGDTYVAADLRRLEWTDTSASWPTLTGATIQFAATRYDGTGSITKTGAVLTATGTNKKVGVELVSGDTAGKTGGNHRFEMQATLTSGNKVTLVRADLLLLEDIAA